MKLKRLLIYILLVSGMSLTSCASYSTNDIEDIYNYIQEKGLDISSWEGLNFQYTFKSSSERESEDSKMSVKVSHYKGEYRALITSKTKYSYTWGSYQDTGTIYIDLYSESDWSIMRMKGKENGESFSGTFPFSHGRDETSLMSNATYYLKYIPAFFEDALSWYGLDSIKRNGSLKENGNGVKISFSASYKDKYKIDRYGEVTTYTDKGKYTISLNYDINSYVSSFSCSIESSSKSSDSKESAKTSVSASPYNKKISTPSWAK